MHEIGEIQTEKDWKNQINEITEFRIEKHRWPLPHFWRPGLLCPDISTELSFLSRYYELGELINRVANVDLDDCMTATYSGSEETLDYGLDRVLYEFGDWAVIEDAVSCDIGENFVVLSPPKIRDLGEGLGECELFWSSQITPDDQVAVVAQHYVRFRGSEFLIEEFYEIDCDELGELKTQWSALVTVIKGPKFAGPHWVKRSCIGV